MPGVTNILQAVAEELAAAMSAAGIGFSDCSARPCGHVSVIFDDDLAATGLLSLAVPEGGPGSLRDRACAGLLSIEMLHDQGFSHNDPAAVAAFSTGWVWGVYPSMEGEAVTWHMNVDMTQSDAATLAANINRSLWEAMR